MGECFFWYWPTWVVPDKGPLDGCVCVCVYVCVRACVCVCNIRRTNVVAARRIECFHMSVNVSSEHLD